MVLCPRCESDLDLDEDELEEGDAVSCTECGSEFEVVTTEPLDLALVGADDDDDDDEDAVAAEAEDEDE